MKHLFEDNRPTIEQIQIETDFFLCFHKRMKKNMAWMDSMNVANAGTLCCKNGEIRAFSATKKNDDLSMIRNSLKLRFRRKLNKNNLNLIWMRKKVNTEKGKFRGKTIIYKEMPASAVGPECSCYGLRSKVKKWSNEICTKWGYLQSFTLPLSHPIHLTTSLSSIETI